MDTKELYEIFKTDFLPKIQAGLEITKDYFMDFFGRYIEFLLIERIILLSFSIILFLIFFIALIKFIRCSKKYIEEEGEAPWFVILSILCCVVLIGASIAIVSNISGYFKLKYVPEMVIYKEFKWFNNLKK